MSTGHGLPKAVEAATPGSRHTGVYCDGGGDGDEDGDGAICLISRGAGLFSFFSGSGRVAMNGRRKRRRSSSSPERYFNTDAEWGDMMRREESASRLFSMFEIEGLKLED